MRNRRNTTTCQFDSKVWGQRGVCLCVCSQRACVGPSSPSSPSSDSSDSSSSSFFSSPPPVPCTNGGYACSTALARSQPTHTHPHPTHTHTPPIYNPHDSITRPPPDDVHAAEHAGLWQPGQSHGRAAVHHQLVPGAGAGAGQARAGLQHNGADAQRLARQRLPVQPGPPERRRPHRSVKLYPSTTRAASR